MWTFLAGIGYFSVVLSGDGDQLVVRTRVRADLVRLRRRYLPGIKIIANGGTDYPFRCFTTKQAWSEALRRATEAIDFFNFKGRTAAVLGREVAAVYGEVWRVLHGLRELHPHAGSAQPEEE